MESHTDKPLDSTGQPAWPPRIIFLLPYSFNNFFARWSLSSPLILEKKTHLTMAQQFWSDIALTCLAHDLHGKNNIAMTISDPGLTSRSIDFLITSMFDWTLIQIMLFLLVAPVKWIFARKDDEAAETAVFCAVKPELHLDRPNQSRIYKDLERQPEPSRYACKSFLSKSTMWNQIKNNAEL